jgi:hypothetical protein
MRVTRRFVVPLFSFLAGVTVPLVLGAGEVHVPQFDQRIELGRMGKDRAMPNSIVVEVRGQCFVLTWTPFQSPQKLGTISFIGNVQAVPLRAVEMSAPPRADEGQNQRPAQHNAASAAAREREIVAKERR